MNTDKLKEEFYERFRLGGCVGNNSNLIEGSLVEDTENCTAVGRDLKPIWSFIDSALKEEMKISDAHQDGLILVKDLEKKQALKAQKQTIIKEVEGMRKRRFISLHEIKGDLTNELDAFEDSYQSMQAMIRASYQTDGYQRALNDIIKYLKGK
jgi:hypothetical protein